MSTPRSRPRPSRRSGRAAAAVPAVRAAGVPARPRSRATTKEKVEAAVLARYAGATIVRTETNGDAAAPYESHIRTSAGKELEVLVSRAFAVVDAREHPGHP